jgi:glutamate-1-semialdehyde 2,1-aminomutase
VSNICYAPFIHKYIHPNDGPRVCCTSTEPLGTHTEESLQLEKHWQSEYYQNLRTRMLAGEKLDICNSCWTLEKDGIESDRQMFDRKYEKHGEPKLDVVTGTVLNKPLDLDIRPSNLCNLKCRMCTPKYSSQLQKEQSKNPYLFKWSGDTVELTPNIMTEENIE